MGVHGAVAGRQHVWEAEARWKWRPAFRAAAQVGREPSSVESLFSKRLAAAMGSPCNAALGCVCCPRCAQPPLLGPLPTPCSLTLSHPNVVATHKVRSGRATQGREYAAGMRSTSKQRRRQMSYPLTCPPALLPTCCPGVRAAPQLRLSPAYGNARHWPPERRSAPGRCTHCQGERVGPAEPHPQCRLG